MKHKQNCECYYCKHGYEAGKKFEANAMKNHGFYIHFVLDSIDCPNGMNIHTHGLPESFSHLDIQICIRLDEKVAMGFLNNIVHLIKAGQRFEPGIKYPEIADGYSVEFIHAIEQQRPVLRLLVPNKNGNYAGIEFNMQLTMTGVVND